MICIVGGKAQAQSIEDLQNLSIEQLAQVQVTTVAKRPEPLSQAPASIFVITSDDIRRSGATSLPEVLRLAPNLEVARLNAYTWTVSARGFNSPEASNKLLVLIDGRSVYEPIASGVLWQQVDINLDLIARIEVISGPGGTLWGANAVNGVINIITKHASDAQGVSLDAGGGDFERTLAGSISGKIGDQVDYRLSASGFDYGETPAATAADTSDDAFRGGKISALVHGAFGPDSLSLQGDYYHNAIADNGGDFDGGSADLHWTHAFENSSDLDLLAYFAQDDRSEPTLYESRQTFDVQVQDSLQANAANHLVIGGEGRLWREDFQSFDTFFFANPKTDIGLGSLFGQDEMALRRDLKLTLGMKLEDNSYSGLDWLPNLRLAWTPSDTSMLWAAVSRAVRTPNRIERELEDPGFLAPSPDFESEKLIAFETGWRGQPTSRSSLSVSAYYNIYTDLRTDSFSPTATGLPIILMNGAEGDTYGLEAWAKYALTSWWRLSAGADFLHKSIHLKGGATDLADLQVAGQDPSYQAQVHSQMDLPHGLMLDLGLRGVDHVTDSQVPGYVEADARLAWRVTRSMELSLDGQNLLHDKHLEVWDPSTLPPRYIPRTVFVRLRVRL